MGSIKTAILCFLFLIFGCNIVHCIEAARDQRRFLIECTMQNDEKILITGFAACPCAMKIYAHDDLPVWMESRGATHPNNEWMFYRYNCKDFNDAQFSYVAQEIRSYGIPCTYEHGQGYFVIYISKDLFKYRPETI